MLGLGSNVGDRLCHLQAAVDAVAAAGQVLALSPVVESDPVGGPEQPDFLNAVVVVELPDGSDPLAVATTAEQGQGRTRDVRWGPRTLDVDVIAVTQGGQPVVSDDPRLTLPHPRAHERAFVLVPWVAVDPAAELPGWGAAAGLLSGLPAGQREGVRLRPDLQLLGPACGGP